MGIEHGGLDELLELPRLRHVLPQEVGRAVALRVLAAEVAQVARVGQGRLRAGQVVQVAGFAAVAGIAVQQAAIGREVEVVG